MFAPDPGRTIVLPFGRFRKSPRLFAVDWLASSPCRCVELAAGDWPNHESLRPVVDAMHVLQKTKKYARLDSRVAHISLKDGSGISGKVLESRCLR